jgi:hypothetical protein
MNLYPLLKDPLVQYYLSVFIVQIPMVRIFERAGFRPWWVLLLAVPMIGYLLAFAVLTFKRWPVLPKKEKRA